MKAPAITVFYRKLGKEKARGLAFVDKREIHIDSRLVGKELLYVLVHEIMHVQNGKWAEIKVEGHSKEMADIIWEEMIKKMGIVNDKII